jgi:hypothetical protein
MRYNEKVFYLKNLKISISKVQSFLKMSAILQTALGAETYVRDGLTFSYDSQ